jgi:predicted nucleic acid-binding protein
VHYVFRNRTKSKTYAIRTVTELLAWAEIAETTKTDANAVFSYAMRDFEDALQLAAAVACGADVLLTRNTKDFKASPLLVMTPEAFLAAYPTPF